MPRNGDVPKGTLFLGSMFVSVRELYTAVIQHAMENGPFEDVCPIKNGYSIDMLSWLVNLPSQSHPPSEIYKGLIAGLTKGNQWCS